VPLLFTRTLSTTVCGRSVLTRALLRFAPRISKRTGLIRWLVHH